jgi:hypothetical protein
MRRRYPDGNVRHIRYPVAETMDEDGDLAGAAGCSGAWDGAPSRARAVRSSSGTAGPGAAPPRPQPPQTAPAAPEPTAVGAAPAQQQAPAQGIPNSSGGGSRGSSLSDTAAFLESLFDSSYAAAQPQADITHCYKASTRLPPPSVAAPAVLRPLQQFTRAERLPAPSRNTGDRALP